MCSVHYMCSDASTAIVIGGGIGGLAAAAALKRKGWRVRVLERAASLEPIGSALAIGPNALRALDLLGVGDPVRKRATVAGDAGLRLPGGAWLSKADAAAGIARYGFLLPMDETQAQVALDLSGRPFAQFAGSFGRERVGGLPTELVPHFFRSFSEGLRAAVHLEVHGENSHHMVEACFKCVGQALRQAFRREGRELPSTKGVL